MSVFLVSTSDKIQLITASAVTTMQVQASFLDYNGTTVTPGRTNTNITSAATTDVVAAPGSSTQRNVKRFSVFNSHASSSNDLTVQHTDGATISIMCNYTLLAQETLIYEAGAFYVLNAYGTKNNSANSGRLLQIVFLNGNTNVAETYLTGPQTNLIKVRVQGGGGAGGGAATATSSGSAGGGGSAGGYAEKWLTVSPYAACTWNIGLAGAPGTAGNNPGGDGGATTFVFGATTITANGGKGGNGMAAGTSATALGGASPSVSTGGDLNLSGEPGLPGITISAAVSVAGAGGTSHIIAGGGNARITQGAGTTSPSGNFCFGAGGGGGCCVSNGGSVAGGQGSRGVIIIEEYS